MPSALITGITGQDGSYLAEFLLEKGYEVHGMYRRSSSNNTQRIDNIKKKNSSFYLHYGDMTDTLSISNIIAKVCPDEIYNLAAQSHVAVSFEQPLYTADCDALGTLRILESVRQVDVAKKIRIYQASTSELYGRVMQIPQTEITPFYPRSPYAAAKMYAYWITINYRESYGMYACNGILFNHESPRRGETFVTRKITMGLCNIKCGIQQSLSMGNLEALRDWGHAKDYVEMQWLMLQQKEPQDYVIATGKQYSVKQFIEATAAVLDMELEWHGSGIDNKCFWTNAPKEYNQNQPIVVVDSQFYRPTEVETLLGDPSKASRELGWSPKTTFEEMVREMTEHDLKKAQSTLRLQRDC